jgi:hypothetical protein
MLTKIMQAEISISIDYGDRIKRGYALSLHDLMLN